MAAAGPSAQQRRVRCAHGPDALLPQVHGRRRLHRVRGRRKDDCRHEQAGAYAQTSGSRYWEPSASHQGATMPSDTNEDRDGQGYIASGQSAGSSFGPTSAREAGDPAVPSCFRATLPQASVSCGTTVAKRSAVCLHVASRPLQHLVLTTTRWPVSRASRIASVCAVASPLCGMSRWGSSCTPWRTQRSGTGCSRGTSGT